MMYFEWFWKFVVFFMEGFLELNLLDVLLLGFLYNLLMLFLLKIEGVKVVL